MGASMAKNLVAAKMDVSVFDLSQASLNTLKEAGAKGVLRGPDGIFENAKPGTLIIDSSTIDPLASKSLHEEANSKKLKMLDAP
eukprot:gene31828-39315_t